MAIIIIIIGVLAVGIAILAVILVRMFVNPKKVETLANLLKTGKTQTAIKTAKIILAKEPRNAEAHYYLGKAYLAENKAELALHEFKTVNQIGVTGRTISESEFRKTMAQLFSKFGQLEEALKEYVLLIKLEPNNADNYYWAGKIFTERNRTDMAQKYLRKAADLSPKDGKIHYELGVMLYKDKKISEAKSELEQALKYQQDNFQAYYYLGKLQKDTKDFTAALNSFEKAQRDAQFKVKSLVERGSCYMTMNAPEKAIPELERAVKAVTDEKSQDALYARYFLAMCYEKIREIDKAMIQWDKIYASKNNFRDVAEKLAQYQEFRQDDKMKDFLTSNQNEFLDICKSLVSQAMSLSVQDIKPINNGCEVIAIENDNAKWRNTRKMPRLIRFFRMPEMVDESKIRSLLEDMKNQNMNRCTLVTSSGFTRAAIEFSDSRPIELFDKEQLQMLFQQVKLSGTEKK
jgi:tetratricopeptide (TPR) repeat protein